MLREQHQQEYVVEVDQDAVLAARNRVLRTLRVSAWIGVLGGGALLLLAGVFAGFFAGRVDGALVWAAFLATPGLVLAISEGRRFARIRGLQATWRRTGVPQVAMRLSAQGLALGIDAAPEHVFLPWPAVAGLRVQRSYGQSLLMIDLAPGVTPASPGVSGLGHPDVQAVLRKKVLGVRGLRVAVRTLRRPLQEIDQAAAYFTQGRVRLAAG